MATMNSARAAAVRGTRSPPGPITPTAAAIVRRALIASGPLTTHALHSVLHAPSSDPSSSSSATSSFLPPRPPARNFLAGYARSLRARSSPPAAPVAPTEGDGTWSVAYLKKRVLKEMESSGAVVKITRGKWDKLMRDSGRAVSATAVEAVEEGGKKSKGVKKEEEEHVWMDKGVYSQVLELATAARVERAISEGKVYGGENKEMSERKTRELYGLNKN